MEGEDANVESFIKKTAVARGGEGARHKENTSPFPSIVTYFLGGDLIRLTEGETGGREVKSVPNSRMNDWMTLRKPELISNFAQFEEGKLGQSQQLLPLNSPIKAGVVLVPIKTQQETDARTRLQVDLPINNVVRALESVGVEVLPIETREGLIRKRVVRRQPTAHDIMKKLLQRSSRLYERDNDVLEAAIGRIEGMDVSLKLIAPTRHQIDGSKFSYRLNVELTKRGDLRTTSIPIGFFGKAPSSSQQIQVEIVVYYPNRNTISENPEKREEITERAGRFQRKVEEIKSALTFLPSQMKDSIIVTR